MRNSVGVPLGATSLGPLKMGAGGFTTKICIVGQTKAVSIDVANAYIKGPTDAEWRPAFTAQTLPVGEFGPSAPNNYLGWNGGQANFNDTMVGCHDIVIAPTDQQVMYATFNSFLYKTSNAGLNWSKTGLPAQKIAANSGADRFYNKKIAVHPTNKNIVIMGTNGSGVHYSVNGGTSFNQVAGLAVANPNPHFEKMCNLVCFSASGGTVWISVDGTGIYQSTSGVTGAFTLMASSPKKPSDMRIDASGNLWCCDQETNQLRKWNGSNWSGVTPTGFFSILTVAFDGGKAIAMDHEGNASFSFDGGAMWSIKYDATPVGQYHNVNPVNPVGWLGGFGGQMFPSNLQFDPNVPGRVYMAHGLGVSYFDMGAAAPSLPMQWFEASAGIEDMVANTGLSIPGDDAIYLGVWDQGMWKVDNPSAFVSNRKTPGGHSQGSIHHCWGIDYAANNHDYIVQYNTYATTNWGFSLDRGATFTKFAAQHPDGVGNGNVGPDGEAGTYPIGGSLAVNTQGNILICPGQNWRPVYSNNNGASWNYVAFPGLPIAGNLGFGWNAYQKRYVAAADKTTPGVFYLFNYNPAELQSGIAGFWKTTDNCQTWTQVHQGWPVQLPIHDTKIACVPGHTGHLFMCSGPLESSSLARSVDGAANWTTLANITRCDAFGFGKNIPGAAYPAIYFMGILSGVYGLYRSLDNCTSWQLLANYPGGCVDTVTHVNGDLNRFGRVYIGYNGTSFFYGDYNYKLQLRAAS